MAYTSQSLLCTLSIVRCLHDALAISSSSQTIRQAVRAAIAHDAPQYFRQSQVTGNLALIDQLTHYPVLKIRQK